MSVNDAVDVRTTEDGSALWNKPQVFPTLQLMLQNQFAAKMMLANNFSGRGFRIKAQREMVELEWPWPKQVIFPDGIPVSTSPQVVAVSNSQYLRTGERIMIPAFGAYEVIVASDPIDSDEVEVKANAIAVPAYGVGETTIPITGEPNPRAKALTRGTGNYFNTTGKWIMAWADTPEREWLETWGIPEKTRLAQQFSRQNLIARNRNGLFAIKNDKTETGTGDWQQEGLYTHGINYNYTYVPGILPMSVLYDIIYRLQHRTDSPKVIALMSNYLLTMLPQTLYNNRTSDRVDNSRRNPQLGYSQPGSLINPSQFGGNLDFQNDDAFNSPSYNNKILLVCPECIDSIQFGTDWINNGPMDDDGSVNDPGVGINQYQRWAYEGFRYRKYGCCAVIDGVTGFAGV